MCEVGLRSVIDCNCCYSDCRNEVALPDIQFAHLLPALDYVATIIAPVDVLINTMGDEPLLRTDCFTSKAVETHVKEKSGLLITDIEKMRNNWLLSVDNCQ